MILASLVLASATALATGCPSLDQKGLGALTVAKGGKLKVIFFASWCSSCKDHLQAPVTRPTILLAAFDERKRAEEAVAALKPAAPCYFDDDGSLAKALGAVALPRVVDYVRAPER